MALKPLLILFFCTLLLVLPCRQTQARRLYLFDEIRFGITQAPQSLFMPGVSFAETHSFKLCRGLAFYTGFDFSWSRMSRETYYTILPYFAPVEDGYHDRYSLVDWNVPFMLRKSVWRSGIVSLEGGIYGSVQLYSRRKTPVGTYYHINPKTDAGICVGLCAVLPIHDYQTCPIIRVSYRHGVRDYHWGTSDFNHGYFCLEAGIVF